ncbi:MAG TPA: enolase C-terminal domain-like protein, partial [Inquilinus sp.]
PVPPENIEAQRHVTHSTRTPICTGENLYRKHGYRELIEKQAARIIAPDIPKMGGLAEAKKVADHADLYYIPIAPHNVASPIGTVAGAHVCAAMNNFLVMEFHAHDVEWWSDMVDGGPPIVDGYIHLNDRPGHGLTLNEDVARAHLQKGSSYFGDEP